MDPNTQDEGGWTPIVWAADNGHMETAKLLLTLGANPNVQGIVTPAVKWGEGASVFSIPFFFDDTQNLSRFPALVDNEENTALHWSAYSGSQDIAALLLDSGCDIEATNDKGDRPLHLAARQVN